MTRSRASAQARAPRSAGLAGLLLAGLLCGCASLPELPRLGSLDLLGPPGDPGPGPEVRPDAPPEYDVLVALQHERAGRLADAALAYGRAIEKDPQSAVLELSLAEVLWRSSRFDEATLHAQRALELDPDARQARTLLAGLYRLRREPEAARRVLLEEDGTPHDADSAYMLWQIYLESGRIEDGLHVAKWMVEDDPEDVRARVALATVYENLARPVEAEAVLRDALEIDPGNLQIYGALASSMRQRGDREAEAGIYREILELHEDDHATLVALADAQREFDPAAAIETLEHVEALYPEDLNAALRLAFLLYEVRRYRAAADRFQRLRAERPGEHELAFYHGVSAAQARRPGDAMEAFLSIPPGHETYADARTQIATLHERRGEFELALEQVDLALSIAPSRELELYASTLRAKAGDFDGAVAYLEALIEANPEDDSLVYNLGVVFGDAKRIPEAIAHMQRALEINPDNAGALNYIGYTWAERGERLDEAEAMIERAIELRPNDGYIVDSLGWVYYMRARPLVEAGEHERARGLLERALDELERADELTGGDPVISEHLGDIYLLKGERERALEKFEEAAALGVREDEQPNLLEKLENLRRELR